MDRKQFIAGTLKAGVACCAAALGRQVSGTVEPAPSGETTGAWVHDLERRMIEGAETPAWRKAEFAQEWVRRLMDNVDAVLDPETGARLMQACGRSCYLHGYGVPDRTTPSRDEAEAFLRAIEAQGHQVVRDGDRITVLFGWGRDHQNPEGLILSDGYCMCPLVESSTAAVSPTYCQCSVGYVAQTFEHWLGVPAEVELLESLKMGGRDCRFRVEATLQAG